MAGDNKTEVSGGTGFLGLLTVLFVGLKLTGFIDWSWWWVTAPIWAPITVLIIFLVIFLVGYGVVELFHFIMKHKK